MSDEAESKQTSEAVENVEVEEESLLHVSNLTRNVKANHLKEIFGHYGKVVSVEIQVDKEAGISKGAAFIKFEKNKDAEQAVIYLNGGQIDGNILKVSFVLVDNSKKKRATSPEGDHRGDRTTGNRTGGQRDSRDSRDRASRVPRRSNSRDRFRDRRAAPVAGMGSGVGSLARYGPASDADRRRNGDNDTARRLNDRSPARRDIGRANDRGRARTSRDRERDLRRSNSRDRDRRRSPQRFRNTGRTSSPVRRRDSRSRSRGRGRGGRSVSPAPRRRTRSPSSSASSRSRSPSRSVGRRRRGRSSSSSSVSSSSSRSASGQGSDSRRRQRSGSRSSSSSSQSSHSSSSRSSSRSNSAPRSASK